MSTTELISAGIVAMMLVMPIFVIAVVGLNQLITLKKSEKYNLL